jgi:5-methyltetrahydrofolate--homocysteine methyltransferase
MMTKNIKFSPQDWDRIKQNWTAWWHHDLDRPMVVVDDVDWAGKAFVPQFSGWDVENDTILIDEVLDYYQKIIDTANYYGDAWPRWWPNFGAGVMAAFQGAQVGVDENTVWFDQLPVHQLADLKIRYDPDNYWWRWIKAIVQAAVERWDRQISVAITDLGGTADILASLRGTQNLLMDLYDVPEEVDRLVAQTTQVWLNYYDELHTIIKAASNGSSGWAPLWAPGPMYMLQSDFAYMISPSMFERFVLPDLETICNHLEYGFYHLDGKGQIPHLDMLMGIERLRGIQWIPGDGAPPPEEWLPLLKRIRDSGKLCQLYVSAEGALKIARELGGKGFTFMISPVPDNGIEALVEELYSL